MSPQRTSTDGGASGSDTRPPVTCSLCYSRIHIDRDCYVTNEAKRKLYLDKFPWRKSKVDQQVKRYKENLDRKAAKEAKAARICSICNGIGHNGPEECFMVNDEAYNAYIKNHPKEEALWEKRYKKFNDKLAYEAREAKRETRAAEIAKKEDAAGKNYTCGCCGNAPFTHECNFPGWVKARGL